MTTLALLKIFIGNLPVQPQLLDHHHLFPGPVELALCSTHIHRYDVRFAICIDLKRAVLAPKHSQLNGPVEVALYLTHIHLYDVGLAICLDLDEREGWTGGLRSASINTQTLYDHEFVDDLISSPGLIPNK